ncbi:hypothetical protein IU500_12600 [Nocardia terpenica]|uniref:DUF6879 family protein n=1 Tax=Nocardia terpenica TaxID=455432 RepID=UPI0018934545|nr:DUF6879 family protein [Nocardia terpenica]MBF6062983.1 hypothetical protein [Nocardia terpenica]MBF6104882.1 hypothetical protein [Nocardia terpenica]MBF6112681.1 hypothetical protein [Nocardia terpenica]MBF6118610.1 hypothetical protein [Nocardia terpenica]MBF6155089.1 hypothetical protein [Nocardia terpenica]
MRRVLGGEPFDRLLDDAKARAFHLETHDDYLAENETDSLRAFLDDETIDPGGDWFIPWGDQVRRMANRGVAVQRARIVSEPHTGYTRYLLALARHNLDAGEDVRYLARADAEPAESASEDFWVLDDRVVSFSLFDEDDYWIGGAVTDDPTIVNCAIAIRDRVWSAAIPYHDYLARQAT